MTQVPSHQPTRLVSRTGFWIQADWIQYEDLGNVSVLYRKPRKLPDGRPYLAGVGDADIKTERYLGVL